VEEVESCQIDAFTVMAGLHYRDIITDADCFLVGDQRIAVASKAALIRWKAPRSVTRTDWMPWHWASC